MRRLAVPQEIILEGVHSRIREQECRIVLYDYWSGRDDDMSFRLEKIQEFLSYFGTGQHNRNNLWLLFGPLQLYLCARFGSAIQRYIKSDFAGHCLQMKKIKYYYNTNTLRYEKLETPLRVTLLRVLGFLSASIVTALILVALAYKYFPSTNELRLMQRNDRLQDNYYVLNEQLKKMQEQIAGLEKRDNEVYRAIFEANPIPDSARAKSMAQQHEFQLVQGMDQENLASSVANSLTSLGARIHAQTKSYDEINNFIKNKEQLLACTPAIQPVSNKDLKRIASGFGYRVDPVYKTTKFHAGLDFAAPQGTPIYATANGTVETAGNTGNGYGNHVVN